MKCLFGFVVAVLVGQLGFAQPVEFVPFVQTAPRVDGKGTDAAWAAATWQPLAHLWAGVPAAESDLSARYKVVAARDALYVLAEVTDDTLADTHASPSDRYWDDDCLEIFVDPDASGGGHQYNHQAFAYHLGLAGEVMDLGTDERPISLPSHVQFKRVTQGRTSVWECRVSLYDSTFEQRRAGQVPMMLAPGLTLGFALAYCDNDHSLERETFLGSMPIDGPDKNRAWIDAGLFTRLTLKAVPVPKTTSKPRR